VWLLKTSGCCRSIVLDRTSVTKSSTTNDLTWGLELPATAAVATHERPCGGVRSERRPDDR
jgi:hypothetical protein